VIVSFLRITLLTALGGIAGDSGSGHDGGRDETTRSPARGAEQRHLAASAAIPSLNEWLIRRTALTTADSMARRALYEKIKSPLVLARLLETEAEARELNGDLLGAALRYDSLGRVIDATRLRFAASTRPADRLALRDTLVAFAGRRAGTADVGAVLELLATMKAQVTPAQAMVLARAASRSRLASQAVALFPRGFRVGIPAPADRLSYGMALSQVGRYREALAAFAKVPASAGIAAEAAYQRALTLNRMGQRRPALTALARLFDNADSLMASKALFLAGDIHWRGDEDAAARTAWLTLVRRYPKNDNAPRAAFLAGLVEWENGHPLEAGEEWERAHQIFAGQEGQAAGYWAGRAFDEAGQRRRAEGLWQSVIARDSSSYYAVAGFRRMGLGPWSPPAAADKFESFTDLDSAASRITALRSLSMLQEVQWERDWLLGDSRREPERLLAAANLLRRDGQASAAVTLARRALSSGAARDARTYRLIYPLLHEDQLKAQAEAMGVESSVIAALIRQESIWEPTAKSRAGALGLMQVMPATGKEIARALRVSGWSAEALLDPATNIRFGTHHLAAILRRFEGDLARTLAAYNAGASRVTTWNGRGNRRDPELFTEHISFEETRNYVRIIQRNLALYRVLYGG